MNQSLGVHGPDEASMLPQSTDTIAGPVAVTPLWLLKITGWACGHGCGSMEESIGRKDMGTHTRRQEKEGDAQ